MLSRYTRPVMKDIWSQENKFARWLEIEILVCEAWAEIGVIPKDVIPRLRKNASFSVARIDEIEAEVRHDVIAFVTAVGETVGEDSKHIHYGLTSSDVIDTALSCTLRDASGVIIEGLKELRDAIKAQAIKHKDTLIIGRTHGVHAEPMTFGLRLALWYSEIGRHVERMERAKEAVSVGKLSGAVGTFANIDPRVEEYVCTKLGLSPAPISTQIIQRDRHAEFVCALALIATSLDKFATALRGLQRTEIREVEEPFGAGQKGSSAMPHKRNPIGLEQMSGLSRVVRGHSLTALENCVLWDERDISNSSVERIILPDSTALVDYMLARFTAIVKKMHVYPDNMARNLGLTGGLIFSQKVLLALIEAGMLRDEAYSVVQELAMKGWQGTTGFERLVKEDPRVTSLLSKTRIDECFDPTEHLKQVDAIFKRVGLLEN